MEFNFNTYGENLRVRIRENEEYSGGEKQFRYSFGLICDDVETYYTSQLKRTTRKLSHDEIEELAYKHYLEILEV